uniref:DUF659 domain-containing protein n=2 Tax=Rhizophagus irregularis TaxID=588596 RepID=U9TCZ2_RHIID
MAKYLSETGDVSKLEEHLTNHCLEALASVVRRYLSKVLEQDKTNKKRKIIANNQLTMTDYHDSTKISDARELNSAYELPTKEFLSNQLLERKLVLVNSTVTTVIENEANLILVFNSWISPTYRSIWNFVIMSPTKEKYLYKFVDLSENSHMANYIAQIVGEIIEKIGSTKISVIVFDNIANI